MLKVSWLCMGLYLGCVVGSCNRPEKPKQQFVNKCCQSEPLGFLCDFDPMSVDSVLLVKYKTLKVGDSMNLLTPVVFRKVKERDADPPRGTIDLDDSVLTNTSFSLCLKSAGHRRIYNFENIVIDTMPVYHGYICSLKSYWLDGIFYEKENFYLPYLQTE